MKKYLIVLLILLSCPGYLLWKSDFSFKKLPVQAFIFGGKFISPEGSMVLSHYTSGSGEILQLDPTYIKNSPVIRKAIKNMRIGETKRISFKQSEDWRLSYALNPFRITRKSDGYEISQWIEFDRSNKVYTYLNLGFTKIKVYDNLVHAYDCKPFMVKCKFRTS